MAFIGAYRYRPIWKKPYRSYPGAKLPCVGVHFTREVFFEKQVSSRHLYYYNNCNFYSRSQNTGHLSPTALNCGSFSNSISLFLSTLLLFIFDHFGVESVSPKKYIFGVSNWPPKNLIWKRTYWYAEAQAKMHQPVHFLIRAKYNKSKLSFVQWIIVLYTSIR